MFSRLPSGYRDYVSEALNSPNTYSRLDAKMIMIEAYETTYGLHDHSNPADEGVLELVAYREAEDPLMHSVLEYYMGQFRRSNIREVFQIGWVEFGQLPKNHALLMLDQANIDAGEKANAVNQLLSNQNANNPGSKS